MDNKNWIKIIVSSLMFLGVGYCCKHFNILNFNSLRFSKSQNTILNFVDTPSVSQSMQTPEPLIINDSVSNILKMLPQHDGYIELNWELLAQTKFKPISVDSLNGLIVLFPTFPKIMRVLEGKKVIMKGYVIPIEETGDAQTLVLSANSYTTCFFCGKAGPESIMDVRLSHPQEIRRFKQDEKVAFRGKLKLNDRDYDYFNYIIEEAEWVR